MGLQHFFSLVWAVTMTLLAMTKANVMVFSVYDVILKLDTFGDIAISRTNVTDWSSQRANKNNEIYFKIREVRLLDRNAQVVKTLTIFNRDIRHFEVTDFMTNQYTGVSANGRSMLIGSLGDAEEVLELRFYLFTEAGTIHPEVAPEKVNTGDVRIDVILRNFHDVCEDACGHVMALDLVVDVSGKPDAEIKTRLVESRDSNTDVITVSHGAKVVISDQMSLDGSWVTMPLGFPELEALDRSVAVTLRFPAVSDKAVFGFTVQPMQFGEPENDARTSANDNKNNSSAKLSWFLPNVLFLLTFCLLHFV